MAQPDISQTTKLELTLLKEISDFTRSVCMPIFWHSKIERFPKKINGASCFFLQFEGQLVGVTAAHVIRAYQAKKQKTLSLICQMRHIVLDLDEIIIDYDDDLDVATFKITSDQLLMINGVSIDCRAKWPPPPPQNMQIVSYAGFPEEIIVTKPDKTGEFYAYIGLNLIESVTSREIIIVYDPSREESLFGLPLPPVELNLSGCSGGPVLMHGLANGIHRWFPIGLVSGGPKRLNNDSVNRGSFEEIAIIRARRIDCIRTDGTIERPETGGWLP